MKYLIRIRAIKMCRKRITDSQPQNNTAWKAIKRVHNNIVKEIIWEIEITTKRIYSIIYFQSKEQEIHV